MSEVMLVYHSNSPQHLKKQYTDVQEQKKEQKMINQNDDLI